MTQPLTSCPPSGELSPPAAWRAQSEEAGGCWASTLGSCLLRAAAGKALKQSPPAQVDQEEVPRAEGLDAGLKGHREKDWRRRAVRGETWLQSWRSTWKRRLTEPDEVSAQRQLGLYFNHWGAPHSSSPHSGFVYIFTAAHYFQIRASFPKSMLILKMIIKSILQTLHSEKFLVLNLLPPVIWIIKAVNWKL